MVGGWVVGCAIWHMVGLGVVYGVLQGPCRKFI